MYLTPFTARPIAIGVVHYRHAVAVGASDNDSEELLTLVVQFLGPAGGWG